jgi:hypothetical protein
MTECLDHGASCPATALARELAQKADYIAARASESLSYGDLAYAQSQGWCPSSPDGMGPHIPDDTTDPVTCAECGALIEDNDPLGVGETLIDEHGNEYYGGMTR